MGGVTGAEVYTLLGEHAGVESIGIRADLAPLGGLAVGGAAAALGGLRGLPGDAAPGGRRVAPASRGRSSSPGAGTLAGLVPVGAWTLLLATLGLAASALAPAAVLACWSERATARGTAEAPGPGCWCSCSWPSRGVAEPGEPRGGVGERRPGGARRGRRAGPPPGRLVPAVARDVLRAEPAASRPRRALGRRCRRGRGRAEDASGRASGSPRGCVRAERRQEWIVTTMASDRIVIRGAREHNLKNVDLEIPRDRLVVITGLSGSGKSTLAFDTIYAEGQRRYVESLSAYARQFLEQMEKPDVDSIEGLSPAISIEQKTTSKNPRSTVGTVTEIYDYLRVLYARDRHAALPAVRPGHRRPDRPADGRPRADPAGRHPGGRARPRRAGPQGRVPEAPLRPAPAGLRARPGERDRAGPRRGDRARQEQEAHDRGGRRPPGHPRYGRGAPRRLPRDGPPARGGRGRRRGARTAARPGCSRSASPASAAGSRFPRSRRGCSPSTIRTARAPRAGASGPGSSSIPISSCRTRGSRWPRGRSRPGPGGSRSTSGRPWPCSRGSAASAWRLPGRSSRRRRAS